MTDTELAALTALVQHDAALIAAHVAQYGQQMCAHDEEAVVALRAELVRREVLRAASQEGQ